MHDDGGKKPRQNNEIKNRNTFMENTPCLKIDIKVFQPCFSIPIHINSRFLWEVDTIQKY